jgi:hypothetical protein
MCLLNDFNITWDKDFIDELKTTETVFELFILFYKD